MAEDRANDAEPSEYERLRLENIKRNEEYLKSLGIGRSRPRDKTEDDAIAADGNRGAPRSKRPRTMLTESEPMEPVRRSRRLSADPGGSPEEMLSLDDAGLVQVGARKSTRITNAFEDTPEDIDISTERSAITAPMLRELIASSNALHDAMLSDEVSCNFSTPLYAKANVSSSSCAPHAQLLSYAFFLLFAEQAIVHCAYRMSYMSNRALLTRLNQISK